MAVCMPDKKSVVIGSGVAGMTAAILLANQGFSVTLVEKGKTLAPLLRGFHRGGRYFETGFHFCKGLEKGGALRSWLKALGLDLPYEKLIPVTEKVWTDGNMRAIPLEAEDYCLSESGDTAGFQKFCEDCEKTRRRSPFLSKSSTGEFSPFLLEKTKLKDYFAKLHISQELQTILGARCVLFGVPPTKASCEDFFLVNGDAKYPSYTLPGGGRAIAQAYEKRLHELDVQSLKGVAVEKVRTKNRVVTGVKLDNGKEIDSQFVIYTGSPKNLRNLFDKNIVRPAWFSHLECIESTPEPYILYGLCDSSLPDNHVWYINSEKKELALLENPDPAICIITGSTEEDGLKSCMIMGLTRTGGELVSPLKQAEHYLPELARGWQGIGIMDGDAMRKYVHGSDGSIFGYAHTWDILPVLPICRVNGFFLAGQNIQLPGMLGCIVSSAITSGLIAGVENVLREFKECVEG